jgi:N-acetyl-anhydromuramyl-L-alanine amidase AmpD
MKWTLVVAAVVLAASAPAQFWPPVVPGSPFEAPGRNKIVWDQTPHFDRRPEGTVVDTIVLHHTAIDSLISTVRWFRAPEARVSAHFTIGKDGSIVQHLSTYYRGWHAGVSKDAAGRTGVNAFSVGIEIVNKGDGVDPYTEDQLLAVEHVTSVLMRRFPIKQIVSHEFIATPPGRKSDPRDFPWDRLKRFGVPMFYGLNPAEKKPGAS